MRQKIYFAIGGVALLLAGIMVGTFAGLYFWSKAFDSSTLADANINLMQAEMKMEQLDRGDLDALRTSLNMAIDVEVIRIYQSIESSNDDKKISQAKATLARVAKHRQSHPPSYPSYPQGQDKEKVTKYVEAVLSDYLKQ